jgi:hypothetical protein
MLLTTEHQLKPTLKVFVAAGVWAGGESAKMSPNLKHPTQDMTPHLVIHPLLVVVEHMAPWEIVSTQSEKKVQLNLKVVT